MDDNKITYFGTTDYRNGSVKFGIKAKDRTKHLYVIGKSGMGKSTLLENMAVQDIQNGEGVTIIDPHGSMVDKMLDYVPEHRINDVIYFAPFDLENPIAFNIMENVGADKRHLVASGLMSIFKKIWEDAWSARMEYILNNTILALLEYPGSTLMGVNKMLSDKVYRKKVVDNVTDPSVKSFWVDEFAKWTERMAAESVPAIQNKIGQFTGNPIIRNIVGQAKSSFDVRDAMDKKKILLINLSKGRIGEQNASLLGGMLITKVYLGAMSRADVPASVMNVLPPHYFYVDEFQSFASDSFADILSEARKYKLCLNIAHQYVAQMTENVRDAVIGNVGTMIIFRIGSADAELFEKEFMPVFTAEDIVNLNFAQMYLRMTIDGIGSKPFSANGLPPIKPPVISFREEVIRASRRNFTNNRSEVESVIAKELATEEPERRPKASNVDTENVPTDRVYAKPAHNNGYVKTPGQQNNNSKLNNNKPVNQNLDKKQTKPTQNLGELIKKSIENTTETQDTSSKEKSETSVVDVSVKPISIGHHKPQPFKKPGISIADKHLGKNEKEEVKKTENSSILKSILTELEHSIEENIAPHVNPENDKVVINHQNVKPIQTTNTVNKPVQNKNEESLALLRAALSNIPTPSTPTKPVFETKKVFKPIAGSTPVPQIPQQNSSTDAQVNNVPEPQKPESEQNKKPPQEVPEDVLKKVLETE
ncbi:MAG: type IV secretory system conjugative DNA transfer family protein [Minisyncoccia bacterium]